MPDLNDIFVGQLCQNVDHIVQVLIRLDAPFAGYCIDRFWRDLKPPSHIQRGSFTGNGGGEFAASPCRRLASCAPIIHRYIETHRTQTHPYMVNCIATLHVTRAKVGQNTGGGAYNPRKNSRGLEFTPQVPRVRDLNETRPCSYAPKNMSTIVKTKKRANGQLSVCSSQ